ncbi:phage holin family protein [Roseateles amylovorans]|uniref:Phage holin family protein n=1 Tax=Roseateles amylovorans TaxID=2978473 RepID=A0ABY6B3H2_9BURK|nr:phage holin family protein [Roseateles amylovorans]UXH77825.1 phage holin family protein [Roseateles amylovorans]
MNSQDLGLADRLRRVVERTLELARVRLELLGVELQAELLRLFAALTGLLLALLLGATALLMLLFAALMWVPDAWRAPLGLGLGVLCLLAALLSWRWARQQLSQGMPFAASVAELNRDRRALDSEWGAR